MTNTETYNEKKIEFLDGSTKKINILVSNESKVENGNDNYITLVNGSSSLYSPDDFSLKQYKFYYSYKFNPFTGNNHKDYLLNASVIINYAIEAFYSNWKTTGNKSSTISAYYTPLVRHVETYIYYNKLPEPAMLKSSTGNVFKDIDIYIDEIIKKMIYFSIYNIKNDGTLLPIEILRNTFSTFDCYTNFPYKGEYANLTEGGQYTDEEFKWFLEKNMNVFVDEIVEKIKIDTGLFHELKKNYDNPLKIVKNFYDGEPSYDSEIKFFYDTTELTNTIKGKIEPFINKLNKFTEYYRESVYTAKNEKRLSEGFVEENKKKTLIPITRTTGPDTLIKNLKNSTNPLEENLALGILLKVYYENSENKEFAVKSFQTLNEAFNQVVEGYTGYNEIYDRIGADLTRITISGETATSTSQFLAVFIKALEKIYSDITPETLSEEEEKNGVLYSLSDEMPTEYSIKSTDAEFYTLLTKAYKKARDEFAELKRKDINSNEAKKILDSVCSINYSIERATGANFLNEKADLGINLANKEYNSLIYRYLYYAIFKTEYTNPLPSWGTVYIPGFFDTNHREFKYTSPESRDTILDNFKVYNSKIRDEEFLDSKSEDEKFYQKMKYYLDDITTLSKRGFFYQLREKVILDFNDFANKKIEDDEVVDDKVGKNETVSVLPTSFDKKYTVKMDKNKDYEFVNTLLSLWHEKLGEYEGILAGTAETDRTKEDFIKDILSDWDNSESSESEDGDIEKNDFYLLSSGDYNKRMYNSSSDAELIKKIAFFYIHSIESKATEKIGNYRVIDRYSYRKQEGSNGVFGKDLTSGYPYIIINGEKYNYKELYTLFRSQAETILNKIESDVEENKTISEQQEIAKERKKAYGEYVEKIKKIVSLEKDFFFLEDTFSRKTLPTTPAIDIEFRRYYNDKEGNTSTSWISVSKMRRDKTNTGEVSKEGDLYSYNYFDNFELIDNGGKKEVSITLNAIEDLNLEKIIYSSLLEPVKNFNKTFWKNSDAFNSDAIKSINNYRVSNFRIRFGYDDLTASGTAINETGINSKNFSKRIENNKPVVKSPWLYFLINKLETRFEDGKTIFNIGGINTASYVLENYKIYDPDKEGYEKIKALTAIGLVANLLYEASNKTICILSEKDDEIIYNKETENVSGSGRAKIFFKNGEKNVLKKSDFKFQTFNMIPDGSTEQETLENDLSTLIIEKGEKEEEERSLPTAKQVLDSLVNFLPTKLFIAPTPKEGGHFLAAESKKTRENMIEGMSKELSISYDIVEAETLITATGDSSASDSEYKTRSFIRLFYKGPISKDIEEGEQIRFYKYRGGEESIVKSVSIDNPLDLQKISGVICGFQNSEKAKVFMSQIGTTPKTIGGVGSITEVSIDSPTFVYKNDTTPTLGISDNSITDISKIANNLMDYTYTGNIEILGDPYYIFDDDLEPFRHMIYLKVNRYENINLEKLADEDYDYYSGLYVIKEITHTMDREGAFSTNLKLVKFTMVTEEKEKDN